MLRNACYVLVVGLSMMRDSEIHEISPGSIVDYYGTPAIKSTKGKHDPNLPVKHWWITAPVAEAVVVAEQLSTPTTGFSGPCSANEAVVARSDQMLDAFIAHVNATSAAGLGWRRSRPAVSGRTCSYAFSPLSFGVAITVEDARILLFPCCFRVRGVSIVAVHDVELLLVAGLGVVGSVVPAADPGAYAGPCRRRPPF